MRYLLLLSCWLAVVSSHPLNAQPAASGTMNPAPNIVVGANRESGQPKAGTEASSPIPAPVKADVQEKGSAAPATKADDLPKAADRKTEIPSWSDCTGSDLFTSKAAAFVDSEQARKIAQEIKTDDTQQKADAAKKTFDEMAIADTELGRSFKLVAKGKCAKVLQSTKDKITIHINGTPMPTLTVEPPLQSKDGVVGITFWLVRDSSDSKSREAWDTVLRHIHGHSSQPVPLSISLGSGQVVPVTDEQWPMKFAIARTPRLVGVGVLCFLIFVFAFWYLVHSGALFDASAKVISTSGTSTNATGTYSLGRSQMAFWGLLVFVCFLGILLVTGTLERIPGQALVLLGISATTGLGSVLIGDTKNAAATGQVDKLVTNPAATPVRATIIAEGTAFKEKEFRRRGLAMDGAFKNFFNNICSDGTGISFPRVQHVLWTLVLGASFVWSVVSVLTMPEFENTLLLLMGISGGTYLGFKFPVKTPDNP